jgi:short-subunit dehydrogenase
MAEGAALITGASSGIGNAFARLLAAQGRALVLVARNDARLRALAEELSAAWSVDVETLPADLRQRDGLDRVCRRLADESAPVHVLVNNAGYTTYGQFLELPVDEEAGQVELHVLAPLRLTHTAARAMAARRSGQILNVASTAGLQPGPGLASYAASKAALVSLSESLHEELRPLGITVTCLAPGYTRTELQTRAGADAAAIPRFLWQDADAVAAAGLRGLQRCRPLVVPGAVNRLTAVALRLAPRRVARRSAGRLVSRVRTAATS